MARGATEVTRTGLDVHAVLGVLRRHLLLALCLAVIPPATALAYSLHATKEYTASATLLFSDNSGQTQQPIFGGTAGSDLTEFDTDPARVMATNIALVSLGAVINSTASVLHM